jgi:hypothetical protein
MPTNSTDRQAGALAKALSSVQPDLFGVDPSIRREKKAALQRSSKWLRDLRQSHAEAAAELLTLNTVAAKECYARGDFEGLARHSTLVLQYTLPRLNAVVLPNAGSNGGPMVVSWQDAAPEAGNDDNVIDQ